MIEQQRWYAGVDWASANHHVLITDDDGQKIGEKVFKHGGEGLAEMASPPPAQGVFRRQNQRHWMRESIRPFTKRLCFWPRWDPLVFIAF